MLKKEDCVIFGLSDQHDLAAKVAQRLRKNLTPIQKTIFADNEVLLKSSKTVRNKKVYIICSIDSSDSLMELLLFVDSLKRASALSVIVISTYLIYSRQDRKASEREPIGAKIIAKMLESVGVDKLITFDLHNSSIQGFYDIPVDDLRWVYPLTHSLLAEEKKMHFTIVSPDHGGSVRARKFAELIKKEVNIAIIDKRRTGPNVSEIVGLLGNVEGKNCIIVDDIIDTGGTIIKAAEYLKQKGAKKIYLAATHGLFSKGFDMFDKNDCIDRILISDSLPKVNKIESKKLEIISLETMIANAIEIDFSSKSMAELYSFKKLR